MKFVIEYSENDVEYEVIWEGQSAEGCIKSFWNSFDYDDRENVTNVKIYSLTIVHVNTDSSILYS